MHKHTMTFYSFGAQKSYKLMPKYCTIRATKCSNISVESRRLFFIIAVIVMFFCHKYLIWKLPKCCKKKKEGAMG